MVEIVEQIQGAITVIRPVGPITAVEIDQVKSRAVDVMEKNMGRIVFDASAVPFVDSRGIEMLADLTEQLSQGGRALKLCGAQPTLREVLELTGWANTFEFFDDV